MSEQKKSIYELLEADIMNSDLSEADSEWKTLMEKSQYIGPYTLDYFGFRIYMWN